MVALKSKTQYKTKLQDKDCVYNYW